MTPQELLQRLMQIRGPSQSMPSPNPQALPSTMGMQGQMDSAASQAPLPQPPMAPPSMPPPNVPQVADPRMAQLQGILARSGQGQSALQAGLQGMMRGSGGRNGAEGAQLAMQGQQQDQQAQQQRIQNTMAQLKMIQDRQQQGQQDATAQAEARRQADAFPLEQRTRAAQAATAERAATAPRLRTLNPGDEVIDEANPTVPLTQVPVRPPKKTYQQKDIMGPQGGKGDPVSAGYDPDTNKYYDTQGAEIPNAQPYLRAKDPKDTTEQDRNRVERSFNSRASEVEKVAQPIADGIQRVGRLMDTISNGSPMADSVTAPELMVVMAGGQGSGVRITQSEINSIVGGQSRWEAMKAALNQWNTDPAAANKILEPMRNQIKSLVNKVNEKLTAKETVIEDARQKLIDTDDPKEHKQIVADAKKALSAIDSSGTSTAPSGHPKLDQPKAVRGPALKKPIVGEKLNGYTYLGGDPTQPESWKKP